MSKFCHLLPDNKCIVYPLELADAFQALENEYGLSMEKVCKKLEVKSPLEKYPVQKRTDNTQGSISNTGESIKPRDTWRIT